MHVRMHVCMLGPYGCMDVGTDVRIDAHMHACMSACLHTCHHVVLHCSLLFLHILADYDFKREFQNKMTALQIGDGDSRVYDSH